MPKRMDTKKICNACRLHFRGEKLQNIARLLDVAPGTITRWRKTQIWKDFEAKLIDEWHLETKENATQNTRL